ncbi:MAG: sugar ABC transporter permease [Spirochaetaceae bacterium]|nr:MAG: sugar ABC transporter permease [Spirochaetaceae bacterium]
MKRKPIVGWILLCPAILWTVGVVIFPFFYAFRLSFTKSAYGFGEITWVGLTNYARLLTDSTFWRASLVSFGWLFGNLILQLSIPMILALFLNRELKGRDFARTLILTPWIIPTIVSAIIWRWILEPTVGVVNDILVVLFGSEPVAFLGSLQLALVSIIGINTWRFSPLGTVLLLAALQTIPNEYYEAARVDGSSRWQEFRFITFPLVGNVVWFVALLATIWIFNIVDLIWLLTEGGPGNATQTLPVFIYRTAFKLFNMGSATAMAVIVAVFLIGLGILYFRIFRPKETP